MNNKFNGSIKGHLDWTPNPEASSHDFHDHRGVLVKLQRATCAVGGQSLMLTGEDMNLLKGEAGH